MKKTLIALAALAASAAFAQSTVTLFGGADLNYRSVDSGANKFNGMAQDGIYSSRFGVNGTEDLGGGLKANFHFEGGMAPDVGTSAALTFTRKSIVGVSGNFGEVRLGRDYTPAFTVHGFDPFGTNGVGSAGNLMFSTTVSGSATAGTFVTAQAAAAATAAASTVAVGSVLSDPNAVRANNSVTYDSPSFSGFSVAAMYGFGVENNNIAKNQAKVTSVKIAYDAGPVSVAYGTQQTNGGNTSPATDDLTWTTNLIGASYNFGAAKVHFLNRDDKVLDGNLTTRLFGVSAPVGALTLKATYITKTADSGGISVDAGNQTAFGGVYDLSKRTSVYATYSKLDNKAGFGNGVGSAAVSDFTGLSSTGFEMGVKHSF